MHTGHICWHYGQHLHQRLGGKVVGSLWQSQGTFAQRVFDDDGNHNLEFEEFYIYMPVRA
jgi:hypothetical protein